ncbi:hypothetical protein NDU88_008720 [Pleurodeles waltl]|uniref:Uncharacterized protein n=1 Tax=Pleurodeles waltl TaxID=8319 RepID=A0AAV7PSX9_PLEWA|nr:hypothetical protein NDU88_008720 [Pleurodeles waltl]
MEPLLGCGRWGDVIGGKRKREAALQRMVLLGEGPVGEPEASVTLGAHLPAPPLSCPIMSALAPALAAEVAGDYSCQPTLGLSLLGTLPGSRGAAAGCGSSLRACRKQRKNKVSVRAKTELVPSRYHVQTGHLSWVPVPNVTLDL